MTIKVTECLELQTGTATRKGVKLEQNANLVISFVHLHNIFINLNNSCFVTKVISM